MNQRKKFAGRIAASALFLVAGAIGLGSAYDPDQKTCGTQWTENFDCGVIDGITKYAYAIHTPGTVVSWKYGTAYSSLSLSTDVRCTWLVTGIDCSDHPIYRDEYTWVPTRFTSNNCSQ